MSTSKSCLNRLLTAALAAPIIFAFGETTHARSDNFEVMRVTLMIAEAYFQEAPDSCPKTPSEIEGLADTTLLVAGAMEIGEAPTEEEIDAEQLQLAKNRAAYGDQIWCNTFDSFMAELVRDVKRSKGQASLPHSPLKDCSALPAAQRTLDCQP
jgi:hypothetical protein